MQLQPWQQWSLHGTEGVRQRRGPLQPVVRGYEHVRISPSGTTLTASTWSRIPCGCQEDPPWARAGQDNQTLEQALLYYCCDGGGGNKRKYVSVLGHVFKPPFCTCV